MGCLNASSSGAGQVPPRPSIVSRRTVASTLAAVRGGATQVQGTVNGDVIATQRIELGRASKLSGNLQTPSLIIEQGAVFEGTSKMMESKAVADKPAKIERKDSLLDASKLETVRPADAGVRKPEEPRKPEVTKVAIAS